MYKISKSQKGLYAILLVSSNIQQYIELDEVVLSFGSVSNETTQVNLPQNQKFRQVPSRYLRVFWRAKIGYEDGLRPAGCPLAPQSILVSVQTSLPKTNVNSDWVKVCRKLVSVCLCLDRSRFCRSKRFILACFPVFLHCCYRNSPGVQVVLRSTNQQWEFFNTYMYGPNYYILRCLFRFCIHGAFIVFPHS